MLTVPEYRTSHTPLFHTPRGPPHGVLVINPTIVGAHRGARSAFRAESARIRIGETIAVGRILYASDVPLIVLDETCIPAKEAVTAYTIMSFGEIDVYIGFAEPAQPTPTVMIEAEEFSGSPLSVEAAEF